MEVENGLISAFISFKRHNQGRSDRTAEMYAAALERLGQFMVGRPIVSATVEELEVFTGPWLHKQGVISLSRRPYIAAVREFFAWAKKNGHVSTNPAAGIQYPKHGHKLPHVLTLASAEKLMWAPGFETFQGVRDSAMIALLIGCGPRVSGLVKLNQSNLLNDDIGGRRRLVLKLTEKGGRERRLPIPHEADMLLRVYLGHDELKKIDRVVDNDQVLFVSLMNRRCPPHEYHGERRRISAWSVRDMIQRYGLKVGIPKEQLHPHAMRHLFGTELEESQVSQAQRQNLMGHADPKSGKIYTHLAMRLIAGEIDRANPLSKMNTPVSELLKRLPKSK